MAASSAPCVRLEAVPDEILGAILAMALDTGRPQALRDFA